MRILANIFLLTALSLVTWAASTAYSEANGLTAYYHRSALQDRAVITGPYDYKAVDRRIDFGTATWRWAPYDMERRFSVYWNGWLYVDSQKIYQFAILANGGAELYIDEVKVVDKPEPAGKQWMSGRIPLERGHHRVEVIYYNWRGDAGVGLYWNLGEGFDLVPSGMLFPEDAVSEEVPKAIVEGK